MTTVSSTSTLKTLMALYENENSTSGGSTKLTKDQVSSIETMLQGSGTSSDASDTSNALLGTSSTSSDDLSSILDAIKAKAVAKTGSTSDDTATTPQQKAVAMMQSLYQSHQSNLFTLIG